MTPLSRADFYKIENDYEIYADCGLAHDHYVSAASTSYHALLKYEQMKAKDSHCELLGKWPLLETFNKNESRVIQGIIGYSTIHENGDTSFAKVIMDDFKTNQQISIGLYADTEASIGEYYIIDQPSGNITLPYYRETKNCFRLTEDIKMKTPYTVFIKEKAWYIGFDDEADYMEMMLSK